MLTTDDFRDVLVINALDRSDEIHRAFDLAFKAFESGWRESLRITFADVSTKEQLAAAINDFKGSIIVFDGHGRHEKGEAAQLLLKGTSVDVWELKGLLTQIPPIVILSACDTHAADRNHATTGNGFLSLGVRTVLASVFPLFALDAATFIARLLFRVAVYLPMVTRALGRAVGWNEVVSGMLRMKLLTDYLRKLNGDGLIDESTYLKVHKFGNEVLNGGEMPPSPEPFALVDQMLINEFALPQGELKSAFQTALASSSVLSYIQLGRPETIAIATPEAEATFGRIYEAIHAPEDDDATKPSE